MPLTEEEKFKMYRVEIELPWGEMHPALETILRGEAETYYEAALAWNLKHNLKRRVRLVIVNGSNVDEVIHDTCFDAVLDTSARDWHENEDGEPTRCAPKARRTTN